MNDPVLVIIGIVIVIFGAFFVMDSLFFHSLTMDYTVFGMEHLDVLINHWVLGLILLAMASYLIITGYEE